MVASLSGLGVRFANTGACANFAQTVTFVFVQNHQAVMNCSAGSFCAASSIFPAL
jgi:hypothetical protein